MTDHGLGALQSPPELLAQAWPIGLALAAAPIPAPLKFHSPKCDAHATLNQNGYGACVCASGAYIQSDLDAIDPAHLAWLRLYAILKGLPYPFTPAQDTSPGLNPIQLWKYTKANGWPTSDGSAPHKDADYFLLGKPSNSAAFLDVFQQTLLTPYLGPCQFTTTWPTNWYSTDAQGYLPKPGTLDGSGHAIEACGWLPCSDGGCLADYWCHQTWGVFGHDPELPNHFRVHGRYFDPLGWEAWKVADLAPEGNMNPTSTPTLCDITAGGSVYTSPGGSVVLPNPNNACNGVYFGGTESRSDGVPGAWIKLAVPGWAWIGVNHVTNIRPAVPTPVGFTQADIDKAVAAEKAALKAQVVSAVGAL